MISRAVIAVGLGILAAGFIVRREFSAPAASASDESLASPDTPASDPAPQSIVSDAVEAVKDTTSGISAMLFGTKYDALINASAAEYGMDPAILFRLLNQESHFRQDIIDGTTRSHTGALGIAQFMPATAQQELGSVGAALDPNQAIPGAARYLAKLAKQLGGDWTKAVAAYNWGIGNVQKRGLSAAPAETVAYVQSILGVNIA